MFICVFSASIDCYFLRLIINCLLLLNWLISLYFFGKIIQQNVTIFLNYALKMHYFTQVISKIFLGRGLTELRIWLGRLQSPRFWSSNWEDSGRWGRIFYTLPPGARYPRYATDKQYFIIILFKNFIFSMCNLSY
mgnify:CR=1 FL=1